MAETTSLTMSYHGPAVDDGTMDVQDVGPTLLAIGTLFNETNAELNDDSVKINVHITATSASSFNIDLSVVQSVLEKVSGLFTTSDGQLTTAAMMAILFGWTGLSGLIKRIGGRKVEKVERLPSGKFKMTLSEDGASIEIDEQVMRLFKNKRIREAMAQMVNPVAKDGIEKLRVASPNADVDESITKEDVNSFRRIQLPEQQIRTDRIDVDLEVVSPTFKDNNKWRLSDGDTTYSATIEDKVFLKRIDEGERFSKGDRLRGHMSVTTGPDGKLSYAITSVTEHIVGDGYRQETFELDIDPESGKE